MKKAILLATIILVCMSFSVLAQANTPKINVDWASFLARHDMVWEKMPANWKESPLTGNGMLGSMFWAERDSLRMQVFRGDVQSHRSMTQGGAAWTRGRLQIGNFYFKLASQPTACDMRLSYYDAEVRGKIETGKGTIKVLNFTHANDMAIVIELENEGDGNTVSLKWRPDKNAMPTRPGYPKKWEDLPNIHKQYYSKYPTDLFLPNPDARQIMIGDVNVTVQDMLGGSRHCTAWKLVKIGNTQRLIVSIANRWPGKYNDPIEESVAVVNKVSSMNEQGYKAWKQEHYDWWHNYYPAAFLSIPDTQLETVYWTTMYKLASATRGDRTIIDTASIWQTPSTWPDCHWDFNVPYCYYPMPMANRLHLGGSLLTTFDKYQDNLIKNVRPVEWQEDCSYLPVLTGKDLYQPYDIDGRPYQWTGGHLVWAMHTCWQLYRGDMNDEVLSDLIYPILKRAVNYQIRRLEKVDDKYLVPLSHSPEYGDAPDTAYEIGLLRWGCHAILKAAKRLGVEDDPKLAKYRDVLENLVDYHIDEKTGYMVGRGMLFNRPHRHWCHLIMMHPLQMVTGKTEAERELMVKSMENFNYVNRDSGAALFTFTGLSSMWALLGEGDRAVAELHRMLEWPTHTPNSLYHEFGMPCFESPIYSSHNVHELLFQCYDEYPENNDMMATMRIFPAVPDTWSDAAFYHLRAPGAFLVSAVRKDSKTQWVAIESLAGEPCRIKPNLPGTVRVSGEREFSLRDLGDGIYELDLQKGEQVLLYCGQTPPQPIIRPLPVQAGHRNPYGL